MKKDKLISLIATLVGVLAVSCFILTIWLFQDKTLGTVLLATGSVLIIIACLLLYVVFLPYDNDKLFRNVMLPFFLHAFFSGMVCIFKNGTIADLFHSLSVLALGAYLLSGILSMFRKNFLSLAFVGGILFFALSFFKLGSFASFLIIIVAFVLLLFSVIFFKNNADLAFWNIISSLIVIGFFVIERVRPETTEFHYIMHLTLMSTVCCAVSAVPFEKNEEQEENAEATNLTKETELSAEDITETKEEEIPLDLWVLKRYQNLSFQELSKAPVSALSGVSEDDAALLEEAFGIKTIEDLANNKFFKIADEIFEDSLK